jgi:hypothetical protein
MRTAALRYCLSGLFLAIPALVSASLEYQVKTENAEVFRTPALAPPPLAILTQGETLKLIQRGPAASLVESEEGIQGWMRNDDVLAMESARGQKIGLGEQHVTGMDDWKGSFDIKHPPLIPAEVLPLDRSFTGEIIEAVDKEQVEMRNDDN